MKKTILIFLFIFGLMSTIIGLGYRGKYVKTNDFNLIVTSIGLVITIPYLIYFAYYQYKRDKRLKKNIAIENDKFQSFLKGSKKTILNLNDVNIVSIDNKTVDTYDTVISGINENNNSASTLRKVKINFFYKDRRVDYSFFTTKNLHDLKIHFVQKKEIYIYDNNDDIYIDFSFLK